MSETNGLMNLIVSILGTALDKIYRRLLDCNFRLEDSELATFRVPLLNALRREDRGERPTEGVTERSLVTTRFVSQVWVHKGTIN